jgi:rhodanese-related sulfurtransferase
LTDKKRTASAAKVVAAARFQDAFVLRGGMENWNKAGYPVEKM